MTDYSSFNSCKDVYNEIKRLSNIHYKTNARQPLKVSKRNKRLCKMFNAFKHAEKW